MIDPGNVLAVDDISLMSGYEVRPAVAPEQDIAALIQRLNTLDEVMVAEAIDADDGRRGRRPARVGRRRAGHQARALAHRPGRRAGRLRHPLRARRGRPRRALPHRRRAQRGHAHPAAPRGRRHLAHQDHGRPRHRRAPRAPGRPRLAEHRRPRGRRPRRHAAARRRRVGRPARARQGRRRSSTSTSSAWSTPSASASSRPSRARTARSSSPGPTGSGKTTTLYAALQMLHTPEKNIITIEDPVEYELAGIKQMQVNPKAGLHFATGLRSMMRADPDVIMVGEIRDKETAQIAVEAALTGHLVLSTLHTNDAPGAVARLIEMGVEPFLVASAVDCVRRPAARAPAVRGVQEAGRASRATSCASTASTSTTTRSTSSSPAAARAAAGPATRAASASTRSWSSPRRSASSPSAAPRPTRSPRRRRRDGMRRLRDEGLEKVRAGHDLVRRARPRHRLSRRPYAVGLSLEHPSSRACPRAGRVGMEPPFTTADDGQGCASQAGIDSARDGPWKGSRERPAPPAPDPTSRRRARAGLSRSGPATPSAVSLRWSSGSGRRMRTSAGTFSSSHSRSSALRPLRALEVAETMTRSTGSASSIRRSASR